MFIIPFLYMHMPIMFHLDLCFSRAPQPLILIIVSLFRILSYCHCLTNDILFCWISVMCVIMSWFWFRYPNPSAFTYERRLFCPFEYALQPPPWSKQEHIAVDKPELPCGVSELKQYDGPQCFVIPGNHGWLLFSLSSSTPPLPFQKKKKKKREFAKS